MISLLSTFVGFADHFLLYSYQDFNFFKGYLFFFTKTKEFNNITCTLSPLTKKNEKLLSVSILQKTPNVIEYEQNACNLLEKVKHVEPLENCVCDALGSASYANCIGFAVKTC